MAVGAIDAVIVVVSVVRIIGFLWRVGLDMCFDVHDFLEQMCLDVVRGFLMIDRYCGHRCLFYERFACFNDAESSSWPRGSHDKRSMTQRFESIKSMCW